MGENTEMVERKIEVVRQLKKGVVNSNDVVSLNIKCSEWFAEEVLNRIVPLTEKDRHRSDLGLENANSFLPKVDTAVVNQISSSDDEQSVHSSGTGLRKKFAVAACLVFFVILSVFAFQTFLENRQGQALTLANYEKAKLKSKDYKAVLGQNFDNLLNNLEELTSIHRFKKAFPEITSLPGIAMFKRGEEAAEKAEATKGFIFRVKYLFDRWVERPNDFAESHRPRDDDITTFLSIWGETEILLDMLEQAKENSLSLAIAANSRIN